MNLSPLIICLLLSAVSPAALAAEAQPAAVDAALEKRVLKLSEELRCLVCQNQTIADSHAPLAIDLKTQVREKLAAGESEREIIDFMVARYGDFVLYRPPLKATTVLLWFGPPLLLLAALWLFVRSVRHRRGEAVAALSHADHERARALLDSLDRKEAS